MREITIGPLDEEDWNKLVAMLEKGPTEGQKRIIEEARAVGRRFKISE